MTPPTSTSATAPLLACAAILAAIGWTLLVVRHARRRPRHHRREQASGLFRMVLGRVAGQVPAETLRAVAAHAEAETFWAALESATLALRHGERRRLACTLLGNPHLALERRVLRHDDDATRRERAAQRLGLLPLRASRRALRHALRRGPEHVRFAAARALARHHDRAALQWILRNPVLFASRPLPALTGLLRGFGPASRAQLVHALEHGVGAPRFECALIEALGLTGCRSARGAIARRLDAPHLELRIAAARALGRLRMGESIPALMRALDDTEWAVRAQAARALGTLHASPAVEPLAARVADPSWWVRHHAAHALAAIGGEGHDVLCELIAHSHDPYARDMAREALDALAVRRIA